MFGGLLRDTFGDATNITKGLYAQLYYNLTDTLRATGGFRYTWDTRKTFLHNRQILGLPYDLVLPTAVSATGFNCTNADVRTASAADKPAVAAACNQVQIANFDYPAWAAGLDWQATDDILLYVTTRGAAKAGGWNVAAGAAFVRAREGEGCRKRSQGNLA